MSRYWPIHHALLVPNLSSGIRLIQDELIDLRSTACRVLEQLVSVNTDDNFVKSQSPTPIACRLAPVYHKLGTKNVNNAADFSEGTRLNSRYIILLTVINPYNEQVEPFAAQYRTPDIPHSSHAIFQYILVVAQFKQVAVVPSFHRQSYRCPSRQGLPPHASLLPYFIGLIIFSSSSCCATHPSSISLVEKATAEVLRSIERFRERRATARGSADRFGLRLCLLEG